MLKYVRVSSVESNGPIISTKSADSHLVRLHLLIVAALVVVAVVLVAVVGGTMGVMWRHGGWRGEEVEDGDGGSVGFLWLKRWLGLGVANPDMFK